MTGTERLCDWVGTLRLLGLVWAEEMADELESIVDQIERERACDSDTIENLRLELHEARKTDTTEAAETQNHSWRDSDDAADVSSDAQKLTSEDRDAIAWVREHGGLDAVRAQIVNLRVAIGEACARADVEHTGETVRDAQAIWRKLDWYKARLGESVPRVAYERHLARRQRQIDESHAALRRRNERIVELERERDGLRTRVENQRSSLDGLVAVIDEMRPRLMPEGMEWPVFEDGEPVRIGAKVDDIVVRSVVFQETGILVTDGTSLPGWNRWRRYKEPFPRPAPKVLDADGVEIRNGDTVYEADTGEKMWVCALPKPGEYQCVKLRLTNGMFEALDPCRITHRAPVLAADGRPLRIGETMYEVGGTGHDFEVVGIRPGDNSAVMPTVVTCDAGDGTSEHFLPDALTHERPDSWERLEEEAELPPLAYVQQVGNPILSDEGNRRFMVRDLVRRARALAGGA